jgi:FkbM family methyltransferase
MLTQSITDFSSRHRLISTIRDLRIPGSGIFARWLSKQIIPQPIDDILIKTQYGFVLNIFPKTDTGVERSIYYTGTYEKAILALFPHFLSQGSVFIDIGANIGLMTLQAANLVGQSGKVYAFEPNPQTLNILQKNITLNEVNNVTVCSSALGQESGKARLYANWHINRGGASLIKTERENDSIEIDVIRFDNFYKENIRTDISLIKMDVEGFEMDVLIGFGKLLDELQATLIIECSDEKYKGGYSKVDVYNFFRKYEQFKIYRFDRSKERASKLRLVQDENDLPNHDNIVCIPLLTLKNLSSSLFI